MFTQVWGAIVSIQWLKATKRFANSGLSRRVALTVPTLALALQAVAAAGLITVAPAIVTGS